MFEKYNSICSPAKKKIHGYILYGTFLSPMLFHITFKPFSVLTSSGKGRYGQ